MNAKMIMLAVAVAVIGAGALMMCDDSDAAAGDVLASGSCGTSLTYEVRSLNNDDSQVEIVFNGTGRMTNYYSNNIPWGNYAASIMSATFPAEITRIGNYAFKNCTNLALTELPAGLTTIGDNAFAGCTNLALTELPAGLTSINTFSFDSCTNLALTELPAGITTIGRLAFNNCTNLALTELPAGLTTIGGSAFNNCTNLALTELPAGITAIEEDAFRLCQKITEFSMPMVALQSNTGLTYLEKLEYTTQNNAWTAANVQYSPQYLSRATLQSITFANDNIPAFALYGQNLDTLTITNASGPDVLGIYTAPNVKATASALTVDGTAAYIVRLTDVAGAAELADGGITANDAVVSWTTTPDGYATGPVDASPEVLVYPAGIHTSAPNQYAGLINAIPLIVIVAIVMTIIGMMAVRRD